MTGTKSRLRCCAMPELRDHHRQSRRHQPHQPDLRRPGRRASTARAIRTVEGHAKRRRAHRAAEGDSSTISHSSAATAPPVSFNEGQPCSNAWRRSRSRELSRRRLPPRRSTGTCAAAHGDIKYHEAVRDVILADLAPLHRRRAADRAVASKSNSKRLRLFDPGRGNRLLKLCLKPAKRRPQTAPGQPGKARKALQGSATPRKDQPPLQASSARC